MAGPLSHYNEGDLHSTVNLYHDPEMYVFVHNLKKNLY